MYEVPKARVTAKSFSVSHRSKGTQRKSSARTRPNSNGGKSSARKTNKSYDPHGLGPIEKCNEDENGKIFDIVKNSHKLGVVDDPIPYSYIGGNDGRKNTKKGGKKDGEPQVTEGIHMYQMPGSMPPVFNSVNMEEKAGEFLNVLHKRLGYVKLGSMDKIQQDYETNKRKYEKSCKEHDER